MRERQSERDIKRNKVRERQGENWNTRENRIREGQS